MEWYLLNHWDQWFFGGFFSQSLSPLVTMFFNGCQPMDQRCDGADTWLRSRHRGQFDTGQFEIGQFETGQFDIGQLETGQFDTSCKNGQFDTADNLTLRTI